MAVDNVQVGPVWPTCLACNKPVDRVSRVDVHDCEVITINYWCHEKAWQVELTRNEMEQATGQPYDTPAGDVIRWCPQAALAFGHDDKRHIEVDDKVEVR